jgi:hypothetical protein
MFEVLENPSNDARVPDAGDNLHAAAAVHAFLYIDPEHPLEATGPGHGTAFVRFWSRPGVGDPFAPPGWRHEGAQRAVRRKNTVVPR